MTAVSAFVESNSGWIGLATLGLVLAAFLSERLAPVTIALLGASVMLALGYLPRSELQAVFGNPAPLTIGAMFVLSAALVRTGVIEALASIATRRAERTPKRSITELLGGTFFASALVNNTRRSRFKRTAIADPALLPLDHGRVADSAWEFDQPYRRWRCAACGRSTIRNIRTDRHRSHRCWGRDRHLADSRPVASTH